MPLGGKARHVVTNFGQDGAGREPLQAGDLHHALDGLLVGLQALLNLACQLVQTLFQERDMREQVLEQDAMMGIDPSLQGLAQLGQFAAQRAACELGQGLWITLAS